MADMDSNKLKLSSCTIWPGASAACALARSGAASSHDASFMTDSRPPAAQGNWLRPLTCLSCGMPAVRVEGGEQRELASAENAGKHQYMSDVPCPSVPKPLACMRGRHCWSAPVSARVSQAKEVLVVLLSNARTTQWR